MGGDPSRCLGGKAGRQRRYAITKRWGLGGLVHCIGGRPSFRSGSPGKDGRKMERGRMCGARIETHDKANPPAGGWLVRDGGGVGVS